MTPCIDHPGNPCKGNGYIECRHKGKKYYAHRLAYELHVGPLIKGQEVFHICKNKKCINPEHLQQCERKNNKRRVELESTDITGKKFNKLLVIGRSTKRTKCNVPLWECLCDCGKRIAIQRSSILTGHTKSCGCNMIGMNRKGKETSYNNIFRTYKRNANKKNREFSLTHEEFNKLINSNCHYCGIPPMRSHNPYYKSNSKEISAYAKGKNNYAHDKEYEETLTVKFNGIDRVDNTLGYVLTNSVTCCSICNRAKHSLDYKEFLEWVNLLSSYRHSLF